MQQSHLEVNPLGKSFLLYGSNNGGGGSAKSAVTYYRGAREGKEVSFVPRPTIDFHVNSKTGIVKDTHGVSLNTNPSDLRSLNFVPYRLDPSTIPSQLRIIQRGKPTHFEIAPRPGANLTPEQYIKLCSSIRCFD